MRARLRPRLLTSLAVLALGAGCSSKPLQDVGKVWPVATPPDSDEFDAPGLGFQWQWHANPQPNWAFPAGPLGYLRVFNTPLPEGYRNLWDVPNLLLQKFPAETFTATTKLTFTPRTDDEKTARSAFFTRRRISRIRPPNSPTMA